uniref:Putative permease C29B12.14c n=1 Tax=Talaromyces marneffei PM1 TaxID=1077442 RepID=A0A093UZ44_TALMA
MGILQNFLKRIEVKHDGDGNIEDERGLKSINADTRPLETARRTFGPWEYATLWVVTGSFNIGGWTTGSSLIAYGLNVWQAMLTVVIGNIVVGILCVMTGAPGAKWHIGFPIIQRASWGVNGFVFVVIQRVFLGCIWFSTQVFWGGQCVKVVLTAIWPSFARVNKPLANGTMTTGDFTSFIIFTLLYYPFIRIRPENYKRPFLISCVMVIPTIIVTWIWFMVKARGVGILVTDVSSVSGVTQATGSYLGWMMVLGIFTNINSMSVHVYVQSDYTRYARKPNDPDLAQLIVGPMGTMFVALIGIICTSCAAQLFPEQEGKLLWAPYELFAALQAHYGNSSHSRAAVAFGGLSFMIAQFGMVVANNGVGAGLDLSGLFPRYFTIRRGIVLMSIISFIVQPWALLNGASKFLTVLGGYGVFIGPMTGVMFSDYFLIRKQILKLSDLYNYNPTGDGIYWYNKGYNWRALIAWMMGVWITLPGFVHRVRYGSRSQWAGWSNLYDLSYLLGCLLTCATYYGLHMISPIRGVGVQDDEDYLGPLSRRV